MLQTRPPRPTLILLLLVLVATAAMATTPAGAGPTASYPDPPTGIGTELAALPEAGQDEDANWLPFLGNRELWCTNGNPGYSGCASHHGYPALDIGMPVGTPVHAAGPGRVASAGSDGDARGIYVDIEHDDGIHSRYYHLSSESVSEGQRVERGTRIGRSGMTGRTTSPHLHYEERTAGNGQKDPGVMFGTWRGRLVTYPNSSGHTSWWDTPYGTRLRNDTFAVDNTSLYWGGPGVATGDLNDDGADDLLVGAPGEDSSIQGSSGTVAIDGGAAFVLYGTPAAEGAVSGTGSERILQGWSGVPGTLANNEVAGAAVATGDFDGDGFDDAAIGAPAATVSGERAAGEVVVVHGSAEGLLPSPRGVRLIGVVPESGDQFGVALTAGDFDGDGFDDLVVGAPGEGVGNRVVAGAVTVFRGTASGLGSTGREITAAPPVVAGAHESGDRLGVALAAGDTNGDDLDDLAVGIPGEDTPDVGSPMSGDAGAVLVLRGRPAADARPGLRGEDSVELHLDSAGVAGDGRPGDQLGTSVAIGDVNGDGFADVAAGAVGKDVGAARDAGSVLVLSGSANGTRAMGSVHLTADSPDVAGTAQTGDHLGGGLALDDTDGDEDADLVIGIPGQGVGPEGFAGAMLFLSGSPEGLSAGTSRQFHQGSATAGLAGQAAADDALGAAVALGDLDGDGRPDIVLAVPGEDLPAAGDAGAAVIFPNNGGWAAANSEIVHGNTTPPAVGQAETGDRWGGLFPIYLR